VGRAGNETVLAGFGAATGLGAGAASRGMCAGTHYNTGLHKNFTGVDDGRETKLLVISTTNKIFIAVMRDRKATSIRSI
jgi:hypothetical protein